MADGVGDGSAGEGVGAETATAGLVETVGDGFIAVGGEGVHAAAVIAISAATSQNRQRGTSGTSDDLTNGLPEGNALH